MKKQDKRRAVQERGALKKYRRRSRMTLHYLLLILFLLAVGAVLCLVVFFKIETIEARGTDKYPQNEIVESSGIQLGENLFRVNTEEVKKKLQEKFPYVGQVKISRRFPPGIVIDIEEVHPIGAVLDGGDYVMLAADGRLLERGAVYIPEDVPVVKGLDVSGVPVGEYLDDSQKERMIMLDYLREAVTESGFNEITNVDISDPLNMSITYEDRIIFLLGSEADLSYKLEFIHEVVTNYLSPDDEGFLDASDVSGKFSFRPGSIHKEIRAEEDESQRQDDRPEEPMEDMGDDYSDKSGP